MGELVPDIEVTPEMIEAGRKIAIRYVDSEWESHEADGRKWF
jgi:hypothetical protein